MPASWQARYDRKRVSLPVAFANDQSQPFYNVSYLHSPLTNRSLS